MFVPEEAPMQVFGQLSCHLQWHNRQCSQAHGFYAFEPPFGP